MKRYFHRVLSGLLLYGIAAVFPAHGHADETLDRARELLYTERDQSIRILEQATRDFPHNPAYWEELIHALDIDSEDAFAERASRTALKINPGNPMLLLARARILEPRPALEVLEEYGRLPGQSGNARDLQELVRLGFQIPDTVRGTRPNYFQWVGQLILKSEFRRAVAVSDEGIARKNSLPNLYGLKAMALALSGHYRESLELQKLAGYPRLKIGAYKGLGDCLLWRSQPQLAFLAFGPDMPSKVSARDQDWNIEAYKRIRAYALYRSGDREQAIRLLAGTEPDNPDGDPSKDPDFYAHAANWLLLLQIRIETGAEAEARQLAEKIIQSARSIIGWYDHGGTPIMGEGVSLRREYTAALRWLLKRYPQNEQQITTAFGDPESIFKGDWWSRSRMTAILPMLPTSQLIAQLKHDLGKARDPKRARELWEQLRWTYIDANRYGEATTLPLPGQASVPDASTEDSLYTAAQDAILWRRADAERLYQTDPVALVSSRAILAHIKTAHELQKIIIKEPVPLMEEDVQKLVAIGPGVLADVFDHFKINTAGVENRLPLIAVIKQLGKPQDAPLLIHEMNLLIKGIEEKDRKDNLDVLQTAFLQAYHNHAAAINDCLATITGQPLPAGTEREKLDFWLHWWNANSAAIAGR